jgi:hypothetical protein
MAVRAIAMIVLALGLAAPAKADTTDDAFIANLNTSGMNYGEPQRAIQVAKTVVCGTLGVNPNTSNADLIAKSPTPPTGQRSMLPTSRELPSKPTVPSTAPSILRSLLLPQSLSLPQSREFSQLQRFGLETVSRTWFR